MSLTYLEAIREAQYEALRNNPNVFLYGQDIGGFGGAFKATKNLLTEFPGRVFDAPISEDAMVGDHRILKQESGGGIAEDAADIIDSFDADLFARIPESSGSLEEAAENESLNETPNLMEENTSVVQ